MLVATEGTPSDTHLFLQDTDTVIHDFVYLEPLCVDPINTTMVYKPNVEGKPVNSLLRALLSLIENAQ